MGRCPRCGTDTGPMGGLCAMCNARERLLRDAEQRDAAKRSEQDREKKKNSSGYKAPSAPMDPKVATVICVILAIALVLGVIWLVMHIYNNNAANMVMEEITSTYSDDGSDIAVLVLTREDNKTNWSISVTDYKKGFFGTLFKLKGNTAKIERYLQKDGTEVIAFEFDGYNFDTGLKGKYYIVTIEGKISVIDDKAELIYQEGSEFFDTNYPKLKALTFDAILSPLTEKVVGDQYGRNEQYSYILQANGWQMVVDTNRVTFANDTDDLFTKYVADVSNTESSYTFELRNYRFYGEDTESLDELGKLLAQADYSTSIEIFDGNTEVVDIRYERNGKEHSFEFKSNYGDFIGGTYYSYVINTEAKTIVYRYYSNEEAKWVDETPENNEAMYNELAALIPETYLRNVMDLSKADKDGALGVTTYTMKNSDGETTAILSLAFGKINKLIHYMDDGYRIEMSW